MMPANVWLECPNGYYGCQGEPLISYKETLHRVSKRRRPRPVPDNIDQDTVEYNTDDRDTVDYNTDDFVDYSSDSNRGLIFSIGGLKMDFSTLFMSEDHKVDVIHSITLHVLNNWGNPGIKRPVTQEDKEWAMASLSKLQRFTGMGWILSPEGPQGI
ncbi:uncharacterized protein LOC143421519 [Maylandia zebra]|uniref:uncharacterized protein LOC143421519 n=1 Tax=Maylandia zebra TaxID=106582 RepID=UPI00403C4872